MPSHRSHAKKNARKRAALKKKQALDLAPATPVAAKKGRRAARDAIRVQPLINWTQT